MQTHADSVLIDVRTELEYQFVGHPIDAILIPWNDGPQWEVNPNFVTQVGEISSPGSSVILICRSGKRADEAGAKLEQSGYTNVYTVAHGFEGELDRNRQRGMLNGWRFERLPWEQC